MRNPLNIVDSNKTNFNHIYSDSFHNEHFSSKPYQESESKNNQISLYQQELNDYERRKKRGYTTGNRPLGNFFISIIAMKLILLQKKNYIQIKMSVVLILIYH